MGEFKITESIFGGVLGSIATWVLIFLFIRIKALFKLCPFVGKYTASNMDETKIEGNTYFFKYSFGCNKILLSQKSETRGVWKSEIEVKSWTPINGEGSYIYNNKDWGVIKIWLNKNDYSITVESTPKNKKGKGVALYVIKKI